MHDTVGEILVTASLVRNDLGTVWLRAGDIADGLAARIYGFNSSRPVSDAPSAVGTLEEESALSGQRLEACSTRMRHRMARSTRSKPR